MTLARLSLGRPRLPDPRRDPALAGAWAMAALSVLVMSLLAIRRHDAFWTGRFDLGNMVQAVWSTTQGHPLETTDQMGEQFVRLGAHVDPILILLAPLWTLIPHPQMLLVVQALVVASGALPVFWLGRRWTASDGIALAGVAAYLLYPPLLWLQLSEFHAVAFVAPLLLFAIWAIEEERPATLAITAVLALMCKEHVGLALVGLGIWCAVAHGRRLWGAALAVGGAVWTALCLTVIIPHFAPAGENPFAGRYSNIGKSLGDVPRAIVTDPGLVLREVVTEPKMLYLVALLAPLAFLPLGSPLLLLGALPEIAMNVLTWYWPQYSVQFQYTAVATPFLVAAALRTVGGLRDSHRLHWRLDPAGVWAVALVVAALLGGWRQGPLPVWWYVPGGSTDRRWELESEPRAAVMEHAIGLIPPGVPVSVANHFGSRLSDRRRVFTYPVVGSARWIIVDAARPFLADQLVSRDRFAPYLARLRFDPRFRKVYERDGVVVFRRVTPDPPAGGGR